MQTIARLFLLNTVGLLALAPAARAELAGTWELYPPQADSYETAVQQPINADGTSNFKFSGKSVVPVKFSLSKAKGPVVFQSIWSEDGPDPFNNPINPDNNYSFLSFTPSEPVTFNELTEVSAVYNFIEGNCHGGALRWQVRVRVSDSSSPATMIYYGDIPPFTDCISMPNNQSGLNLLSFADQRFDSTQAGGPFYGTLAQALALVGDKPVVRVTLALDGGWAGDQRLTPSNVTVNGNTFVPEDSAFVPTCNLPPAKIQVIKVSGEGTGEDLEVTSVQPKDNDDYFRVVDCKYMYNLATKSLLGRGRYKVEAVIGGNPVAGAAYFDLR